MIAPVAAVRPNAFKLDNNNTKYTKKTESHPLNSEAAAQLLAKPLSMAQLLRNKQIDSERGFAPAKHIDLAVMDLEQCLFANEATDTHALFSKMQALDAQVATEGGSRLTNSFNGDTYICSQLLRFNADNSESNNLSNNNWGWVNTVKLNHELFVAAADQQRIEVLALRLNAKGASNLDMATRGINALNIEGIGQQNLQLINQYLKLQRSIQLASRNPVLESNLSKYLIETNDLFRDAGLPAVLPAPNKCGHVRIRFDSKSLPDELASLRDKKSSNDRNYGHNGWYIDVSVSSFPPALLAKYAKSQLAAYYSRRQPSNGSTRTP